MSAPHPMGKGRLEAFSDGVIAVIITIMVLELKVPAGASLAVLKPVLPLFVVYVQSFINLGIYWNNHHHMLHACERVTGPILWANLHLLFWLSLIPFTTAWMGENEFAAVPAALYGGVLVASAVAYLVLQQTIIASQGAGSLLRRAVGEDRKGKLSIVCYALAIPAALWWSKWVALGLYVLVALVWFVPDRRIEQALTRAGSDA